MDHPPQTFPTLTQILSAEAGRGRTMLIPALLAAQRQYGCVTKSAAAEIGAALRVPLAEVSGVIQFYTMLSEEPTGTTTIRVCTSPTCSARGGHDVLRETLEYFGLEEPGPTPDGAYFIEAVACLGLCDQAPSGLVDDTAVGGASPQRLAQPEGGFHTRVYAQEPVITRRFGGIDPTSLDDYLAQEGFQGLRNALDIETDYICDFMSTSGLLGRGGAAFVTRTKWESASSAPGEPKYIVCNADESEPGTFKDRLILENDPFAVLEGMVIAGFAVGAEKGFIYIRGEYPKAQRIFSQAIDSARRP